MKVFFFFFCLIQLLITSAQDNYSIISDDSKVSARHYFNRYEGIDSVVIKSGDRKFYLSSDKPLFNVNYFKYNYNNDYQDEFEELSFATTIAITKIKKIKNKTYLLIGIGGNLNWETQLNLVFIKNGIITNYYIFLSYDKFLRDVDFTYIRKTNEIIIPILEEKSIDNIIYNINIKENTSNFICPMSITDEKSGYKYYKLKIN